MSAREQMGWRDKRPSLRHRHYGHNAPFCDVDCVEYDHKKPVAMYDRKHENAPINWTKDSNLHAQQNLADAANLPFFVVRYADDLTWYQVIAGNARAEEDLRDFEIAFGRFCADRLTEEGFVHFLYFLRCREVPDELVFDADGILTHNRHGRQPLEDIVSLKAEMAC